MVLSFDSYPDTHPQIETDRQFLWTPEASPSYNYSHYSIMGP